MQLEIAQALRSPVLSALQVEGSGPSWSVLCPAHADTKPSLSVKLTHEGTILLRCHANCSTEAIVAAVQCTMSDLYPAQEQGTYSRHEEPSAVYPYVDENDVLQHEVLRYAGNRFMQRHLGPNGKTVWNTQGVRHVLYRLPAVIEAVALGRQIFIVEGEKDAENVAGLGLTATTNCGGAGRWRPEYSDALRHAVVTILPDNDETGQRHALAVATALIGVAREIRIVQLPGLPEKGDVSDWIAAGGRREELEVLVANAALFELQPSLFSSPTPPRRYQFHTMDELATFPPTEWLVEELLVCESLAIMYAPPASYKSFLALDIALCVAAGIPWNGRAVRQGAAVYVAAEGNVGQMAKRVSAWCTHHGVDPSSLPFTVVPSMVELGSEHAIADFIRELPSRSAIVVIDTLARCAPGLDENRSADMGRVIQAADRIREAAGGLVLLVHHARKNDSQIRGSSALEAAADTTIALRRSNNAAVVTVSCTKQKDAAEFEDFMLQITDVASSAVLIPAGKPQKRSTLSTNDHKALLALAPEGASSAAWLAACHLRPSSYHESKKRLLRNQLVRQDGKLFRSTASSDTGDSFGELSEAAA